MMMWTFQSNRDHYRYGFFEEVDRIYLPVVDESPLDVEASPECTSPFIPVVV